MLLSPCCEDAAARNQRAQCEGAVVHPVGKPASAKTAVPHACERALQSGEALERQLHGATREANVLSLSSCCSLFSGFSGSFLGIEVGRPPHPPLSQSFRSCPPRALLLPFVVFGSSLAAAAWMSSCWSSGSPSLMSSLTAPVNPMSACCVLVVLLLSSSFS